MFVNLQKWGLVISYLENVDSWQIQGGDITKSHSPTSHFIICFQAGVSCLTAKIYAPGGISESVFLYEFIQDRKTQHRTVLDVCVTTGLCHRGILTINCFYCKQYYKEESCIHSWMSDCVLPMIMFLLYPSLYVTLFSKNGQSLTTGDLLRYWLACCWSKSSALDSVVDFALMLGLVLTFSASSLPDIFP